MKAELVPLNGDKPIPVTKDVTVVGRREFCDQQINFHGVSKRHCVLVKTDGLLVVRDLATTNGTKVNGQRIRWAALLPNDRLTLGGYKMRVYLGPDDAVSPSERWGQEPARPAAAHTRRAAAPANGRRAPIPLGPPAAPVSPVSVPAASPGVGFEAPSPLGTPTLKPLSPADDNWIPPEALIVDDDDDDIIDAQPLIDEPVIEAEPVEDDDELIIELD